jgi:dethiobiotin synthetase
MTAPRGIFVTGTDTGVGKTWITAALVLALRERGHRALPVKPVQTGHRDGDPGDLDFTLARLDEAPPVALRPHLNRARLPMPASPHLAAQRAGLALRVEDLAADVAAVQRSGFLPVVEGAGGLLVPLNDRETMADLAARCGLPIVLVARGGLGTLNHTLLSVEAVRARRLPIAGLVINDHASSWGEIEEDNLRTLARLLAPLHVLRMPHLGSDDAASLRDAGRPLLAPLGF